MTRRFQILAAVGICLMVSLACSFAGSGASAPASTPTAVADQVPTRVPPTVPPVAPTTVPTKAPPTPVPPTETPTGSGPGGCILSDQFIADVSIPDGTVLAAGSPFVKTWRVKNTGTCAWENYKLIFAAGEQMSGPASVSGQQHAARRQRWMFRSISSRRPLPANTRAAGVFRPPMAQCLAA